MKQKQFVRPTSNKPWYFTCIVCSKKHYKWGAHSDCYRRYCDVCQRTYESEEELKEHALKWHKKSFCSDCNMVIPNLAKHRTNFHK